MKRIKEWVKSFINRYIVSEDPHDEEEEMFKVRVKQFEEWKKPVEPKPKPPKKKRGRPKKKK